MLINAIVDKTLILGYTGPRAGAHAFWGNDTVEQFAKMVKSQPEDWYWRNRRNQVVYTINSRGYRCPEFDQIDWASSVVIMGCSNVFGDGLDDKQTISYELSQLINKPVVNLGQGGTGTQYHLHNQCLLGQHYPTPLAVIVIWPDSSRYTHYMDIDATPWAGGTWNMHQHKGTAAWNQGCNADTQAWMASRLSRQLWAGKCAYIEATWDQGQAQLLDMPCVNGLLTQPSARDGVHPGPVSTRNIAQWLKTQLAFD